MLLSAGGFSAAQDLQVTRDGAPPLLSASEIEYPPFCIIDENGEPDGFSVELMRAALDAMAREVTFRTGPWNKVRSWLEQGEVEALPLVGRTPEREEIFDFTFPYMSIHGAIVVRKGTTNIRSLEDLRGSRVAVMEGDNAEEFLRREDRGIDIRTTSTFDTALLELSRGLHDAVVIQRLVALRLIQKNGLTNLEVVNRPIENFQQDFCFAVREGDRDTLALLNEGLSLVIADGTHRRLHAKWFASLELPSDRPIIIGGDYNFPPYEYLDENGVPSGYNVELSRAIARETGLNIEIRLGPWPEIIEALHNGEIDALQGMFFSENRDLIFDFSPPHTLNHQVAVVREGEGPPPSSLEDLQGKRLVVQESDILHDFLVENGLKHQVTALDSQEDALRELAEGKHDCALLSRSSALYWMEKRGWENLVAGQKPFLAPEYCYAVLNDNRPLLAQFSEGLRILEESGEYRKIHNRWLGVYQETVPGLADILKYAAIIIIPLFLVLLGSVLWSWSLRKQVAARTEELRRSYEFQEAIISCSPVALYSVDLDGNVLTWNASTEKIFGWKAEEVIGRPLPIVPKDKNEEFSLLRESVLTSGGFAGKELVRHTKNGELLNVSLSAAPLHDAKGNVIGIMGAMEDITYRKKAEEALRESQRRLVAAQRIARMGDFIWDLETGEISWSDALYDLLGYSKSEAFDLERVNLEIHHPEDLDRVNRWIRDCIDSGEDRLTPNEYRIICRKGNTLFVRTVGVIERRDGLEPRIFATIQDISENRLARDRIEHLNSVLRTVRDVNQLIVREKDRERLIREGCRLLAENRGYQCALIILTDEDSLPAAWAESGMGPAFAALESDLEKGVLPSCCAMSGKSDRALLIDHQDPSCSGCPVGRSSGSGQSLCARLENSGLTFGYLLVVVAWDLPVDEEEQGLFNEMADDFAYALNMIRMEKESEAAERRAASLEDQLHQAQKMESVGRLAGGVAHDYNNMLSVIIGYAELAQVKLEAGEPMDNEIEEILNAAGKSAEITRQLLAFARRQPISPRILDLNDTVEQMLKMLRKLIGEDIDLEWIPCTRTLPINMDPVQVNQVLANLCVNSRDSIDGAGRITIETGIKHFDEAYCADHHGFVPGDYAMMAVSDDGCGMDRETLDKAFEPFFTTKDLQRGTGLGLATVYGIVSQNEGFINAYSEPGRGTTLRIYLKLRAGDITDAHREAETEIEQARGETVLVVEDEPEIMRMTMLILETLGYWVMGTTSPGEAITLAEEHAGGIDLLVTDVVMPEMNGKQLSARLQAVHPGLKTLFMSGYTADVIAHHGVLDEGVHFIQKPFSRKELASKVREALGQEE